MIKKGYFARGLDIVRSKYELACDVEVVAVIKRVMNAATQ